MRRKIVLSFIIFLKLKTYFVGTTKNKQFGPSSGQNVSPDLDPNWFDTLMVFLKEYFKRVDFEKKSADTKNSWKTTQHA